MKYLFSFLIVLCLGMSLGQSIEINRLIENGEFAAAYAKGIAQADVEGFNLAARAANFYADFLAPDSEKANWYARAEEASRQALKLEPNNALGYLYLAQAQGRLSQFKGILENISLADAIKTNAQKALELDPNLSEATMTLAIWHSELVKQGIGWLYGASENKALELMEAIAATEADQIIYQLEYGNILSNLNRPEEAKVRYEMGLALSPNVPLESFLHNQLNAKLAALAQQ